MDKKKMIRKIIGGSIFMLLLMGSVFVTSKDAYAAKKVKLSKTSLTFASDKAKAQTVKVQNIKTSNIKSLTIINGKTVWFSAKKKGKNKIVVTPKRSSPKQTTSISITVEFKKPIKGDYRAYLDIKNVRVKGSSKIAVKTAKQLCNLDTHGCTENRWTYYLANDIDMTGVDPIDYRYTDLNFDGKGYKIISDRPVFKSVYGTIKNVVFKCNYNMTASKDDGTTKLLKNSDYIAPIMSTSIAAVSKCKSIGNIVVNYDKKLSDILDVKISGLVGNNDLTSKITQCKSEVDVVIDVSDSSFVDYFYVGGLVNQNVDSASISECEFSGSISIGYMTPFAGGICSCGGGKISDCLNTGDVKKKEPNYSNACAGIISSSSGTIERSVTIGNTDTAVYYRRMLETDIESDLPKMNGLYYLISKATAVAYADENKPFDVPGITGVSDGELTAEGVFSELDFNNIWKMTDQGPKLRNVPA